MLNWLRIGMFSSAVGSVMYAVRGNLMMMLVGAGLFTLNLILYLRETEEK